MQLSLYLPTAAQCAGPAEHMGTMWIHPYFMVPIKHTVFFSTVTVLKNTVRLIGTIE